MLFHLEENARKYPIKEPRNTPSKDIIKIAHKTRKIVLNIQRMSERLLRKIFYQVLRIHFGSITIRLLQLAISIFIHYLFISKISTVRLVSIKSDRTIQKCYKSTLDYGIKHKTLNFRKNIELIAT